jgi:nicotinamidase/pyrazinamidase
MKRILPLLGFLHKKLDFFLGYGIMEIESSSIKREEVVMTRALALSSVLLLTVLFTGAYAGNTMPEWAVIVVDVQPCFVEGGNLYVPGANAAYVEDVQQATKWLSQKGLLILGTRDYHPWDHNSFASQHYPQCAPFTFCAEAGQVVWPDHCTQAGGDSRELVDNNLFYEIVKKGQNKSLDSYSGFQDNNATVQTELDGILKAKGIKNLVIYGLATDYCVLFTVMNARDKGYNVVVIENLIRGVAPDTTAAAMVGMHGRHVKFLPTVRDFKESQIVFD